MRDGCLRAPQPARRGLRVCRQPAVTGDLGDGWMGIPFRGARASAPRLLQGERAGSLEGVEAPGQRLHFPSWAQSLTGWEIHLNKRV